MLSCCCIVLTKALAIQGHWLCWALQGSCMYEVYGVPAHCCQETSVDRCLLLLMLR
jgi:hypothetical protein